jgi:hypothetical protein
VWLQPRYEEWVNEQVGNAVMKGGGSAVSLPLAQRQALVSAAQKTWNTTVDQDCGPELSKQVRALFDSYSN